MEQLDKSTHKNSPVVVGDFVVVVAAGVVVVAFVVVGVAVVVCRCYCC